MIRELFVLESDLKQRVSDYIDKSRSDLNKCLGMKSLNNESCRDLEIPASFKKANNKAPIIEGTTKPSFNKGFIHHYQLQPEQVFLLFNSSVWLRQS